MKKWSQKLLGIALLGFSTLQAGVVAHYSFDQDFTDSSANNLDLNAHGSPTIVGGGQFGNAVDLDRSSVTAGDWLWNGDNAFNLSGGDFSVSLWYQADISSFAPLASKTNTNSDLGWAMNHSAFVGGDVRDTTGGVVGTTAPAGDQTSFQHVVFLKDGNQLRLYVNDVLVDTDTVSSTADTSNAFAIGARNVSGTTGNTNGTGDPHPFDGMIDEVWVFDHALSTNEINNLNQFNNLTGAVPEPATMSLLGLGLGALALHRRKRKA